MAEKKLNIGLEVGPPANTCSDKKCPWHGTLPVRGRMFTGNVRSVKSKRNAVVQWPFIRCIQKYERYERRHTRVIAYNPECINAVAGDKVKIAECRPLSKTKSFVVVEVLNK